MKVFCAWCQAEGKPGLLREVEPLDDPTETHGICPAHQVQLMAQLSSKGGAAIPSALPACGLVPAGRRRGGTNGDEMDIDEIRRRISDWIGEGQHVMGRMIPDLLEQCDRLRARADAAEQRCERLQREVTELQARLTTLQGENESLRNEQAEVAELFRRVMDQTMDQVLQPMYQMLQKLRMERRR